jgi:hypothetical protein
MGDFMLEVTRYEYPLLFVTRRKTGETYRFLVNKDGALAGDTNAFDCAEARFAALKFLAQQSRAANAA